MRRDLACSPTPRDHRDMAGTRMTTSIESWPIAWPGGEARLLSVGGMLADCCFVLPSGRRVAPFASVKSVSAQIEFTKHSGPGRAKGYIFVSRCGICATSPGAMRIACVHVSW